VDKKATNVLNSPHSLIDTCPPTLPETYEAANKVKAGKAPGSCGVYPEYILHGGNKALKTLHSIFTQTNIIEGTAAAVPPPFRPGNPALRGSCPLVTPY